MMFLSFVKFKFICPNHHHNVQVSESLGHVPESSNTDKWSDSPASEEVFPLIQGYSLIAAMKTDTRAVISTRVGFIICPIKEVRDIRSVVATIKN